MLDISWGLLSEITTIKVLFEFFYIAKFLNVIELHKIPDPQVP